MVRKNEAGKQKAGSFFAGSVTVKSLCNFGYKSNTINLQLKKYGMDL
jgi:hypothetical protein